MSEAELEYKPESGIEGHHHGYEHHIVSISSYWRFSAWSVRLTVIVAYIDLLDDIFSSNTLVALAIAFFSKMTCAVLIFMHARWSSRLSG